ncbi:10284_t:CDS:1, partial [Gigaspora margarita]
MKDQFIIGLNTETSNNTESDLKTRTIRIYPNKKGKVTEMNQYSK